MGQWRPCPAREVSCLGEASGGETEAGREGGEECDLALWGTQQRREWGRQPGQPDPGFHFLTRHTWADPDVPAPTG